MDSPRYGETITEPWLIPGFPRTTVGLLVVLWAEGVGLFFQFVFFLYVAAKVSPFEGVVAILLLFLGILALFRLNVARVTRAPSACILYILWKATILILHIIGLIISLVRLCNGGDENSSFHSVNLVISVFLVAIDIYFLRYVLKCQKYFWHWDKVARRIRDNAFPEWNITESGATRYESINVPPPPPYNALNSPMVHPTRAKEIY